MGSLYLNFVVYDSPTSAIMTEITDEQLEELKEAFTLFDKVGDDKIASEDVIKLLQSLKLNPLTADVKKVLEDSQLDKTRREERHRILHRTPRKRRRIRRLRRTHQIRDERISRRPDWVPLYYIIDSCVRCT